MNLKPMLPLNTQNHSGKAAVPAALSPGDDPRLEQQESLVLSGPSPEFTGKRYPGLPSHLASTVSAGTAAAALLDSSALEPLSPWAFTVQNLSWSSPCLGPDGTVYVGDVGGTLHAISPPKMMTLADSLQSGEKSSEPSMNENVEDEGEWLVIDDVRIRKNAFASAV